MRLVVLVYIKPKDRVRIEKSLGIAIPNIIIGPDTVGEEKAICQVVVQTVGVGYVPPISLNRWCVVYRLTTQLALIDHQKASGDYGRITSVKGAIDLISAAATKEMGLKQAIERWCFEQGALSRLVLDSPSFIH